MFQLGGDHWKVWSEALDRALLPAQRREGCEAGSWDPVGVWGSEGGRIFATAMSILILETEYRYKRMLKSPFQ